jgi:hypothetical protein
VDVSAHYWRSLNQGLSTVEPIRTAARNLPGIGLAFELGEALRAAEDGLREGYRWMRVHQTPMTHLKGRSKLVEASMVSLKRASKFSRRRQSWSGFLTSSEGHMIPGKWVSSPQEQYDKE